MMGRASRALVADVARLRRSRLALGILLAIGFALSREQHDTVDFFLARRRVPWWAACLSFLATEISAVTIISVPATAYSENWEYAQFFIGSSLAKLVVAFLFIRPSTATTSPPSTSSSPIASARRPR